MATINSSTYSINYGAALREVNKKCKQVKSGTYVACEQMIQMSFMGTCLITLDQILGRLEKHGRLSHAERQNLLAFARQLWNVD